MAPPSTHNNNTNTIDTKSHNTNTIHFENMLKMGSTVIKGRQKLRPRKKRLTSLKKRVLMERLDQWRRSNISMDEDNTGTGSGGDGGGINTSTSQSAMAS